MILKKKLTLIISILLSVVGFATEKGIQFDNSTWKDLMAKAKKENKLIVLDAYTTWCGPCKWMAKNVFTNDTVGEYYNANFICAKIDMEKGEGLDIAKKYSIRNYPTILYIDGDGLLIHRTCGVNYNGNAGQKFIADGKDALNPAKQFAGFKKKYDLGTLENAAIPNYLHMLQNACMSADAEAGKYLSTQKDNALSSRTNWNIIHDFVKDVNSRPFNYMISNTNEFTDKYGKDSVENKISESYRDALSVLASNKEVEGYNKLKTKIASVKNLNTEELFLSSDIYLYKKLKDWDSYSKTGFLYIDKFAKNNMQMINNIAWVIYENVNNQATLEKAAELSKHSTELSDEYAYNDTYAALLYKLGKKAEAEKAALHAIDLAKKDNQDYGATQELLNKIKLLK